jgi:arylsulfatase
MVASKMYIVADGVQRGAKFLETFIAYPPSQDPASFSIDDIGRGVKDKIKLIRAQQNAIKK